MDNAIFKTITLACPHLPRWEHLSDSERGVVGILNGWSESAEYFNGE